jgi:endoglucanase
MMTTILVRAALLLLLVGAFAPDPETSLRYAACAARAARLVKDYDRALSHTLAESAMRAWHWAEANEQQVIDAEILRQEGRSRNPDALHESVRKMRALAAVELFRLIGSSQYDTAFRASSWLGTGKRGIRERNSMLCLPMRACQREWVTRR